MPAYVIVDVETSDPHTYEEYKRMAQETAAQFGGRYIVRGAVEWWGSAEYSPAKALRQSLSRTDIVIVDGV